MPEEEEKAMLFMVYLTTEITDTVNHISTDSKPHLDTMPSAMISKEETINFPLILKGRGGGRR